MDTARPMWRPRAGMVAAAMVGVLLLALSVFGVDTPATAWMAALVTVLAAGLVIGWALLRTRAQRAVYEAELAQWAAERATHTERLRIAGDLHDLISHGLGLITVRAAVARRDHGPQAPAEHARALADIEEASRETTTELRRLLTVLRTPGAAPLRPAESAADLPAILEAARSAGLQVAAECDDLDGVSAGAQLALCALVREALHNALRHAGPTNVRLRIRRHPGGVDVVVEDDGPQGAWQPTPGAGRGLDGLRTRLEVLGGEVDAGAHGPGYRLTAHLPEEGAR